MKREEHTALVKAIRESLASETPDIALITTNLATLSEDYGTILATVDQATLTSEAMKTENTRLKESNMELFLAKVGTDKGTTTNTGTGKENKLELKFEDLYDEKGELK